MIQIRYFASIRERLGRDSETLPLDHEPTTVAAIAEGLRQRGQAWREVLGEGQTVLVAVNQTMATPQTPVRDGDEVAFFPPVTGG